MSSPAPDWADTSVRWLRTHHKLLVPTSSTKPFTEQLELALWRMNYLRKERVDFAGWAKVDWRASLKDVAHEWQQTDHVAMVAFLAVGGYKSPEAPKDSVMIDPVTGERIELEMPEDDLETLERELSPPPSQLSPDHELEEIMQAEAMKTDPRLGVW